MPSPVSEVSSPDVMSGAPSPELPQENPGAPAESFPLADAMAPEKNIDINEGLSQIGEPEDSPVPIPGTIQEEPKTPSEKDDRLNLEAKDFKPEGVFQVACIYPEGEEARGQRFVAKLRDVVHRAKSEMEIQVVFIQSWAEKNLDMNAMDKAAALAGATFTFILVPRKEKSLFQVQMAGASEGEWSGRVVFSEQVDLRTLYADILLQLEGKS